LARCQSRKGCAPERPPHQIHGDAMTAAPTIALEFGVTLHVQRDTNLRRQAIKLIKHLPGLWSCMVNRFFTAANLSPLQYSGHLRRRNLLL
jgi:hypothetical protein